MDKIKALLHGTTPEHEKEVKEEKKAEKIEQKEEKKAEKHGAAHSNAGEGSHLAKGPHSETHPPAVTDASHTSHTTHANPTPAGLSHTSGGLAQDNVPHRPRDSEFGSTTTGPNAHAHGIDSAARTNEAGLTGHNTRDPLSSHNAGVPSNTTSGLGGVTSIPSGNGLNTHGRDNVDSHGNSHLGRDAAIGSGAVGAAGLAEHEHRKHENTSLGSHPTHGHAEGSHGIHNSAALNAADPRVDSDLDGNRLPNKTSSGYGTKDAYGTTTTSSSGHHLGRDTAAIGTAGAVGEGVHHHNNQHSQGGLRGTTGPHTTATANLLDPHLSGSGIRTEDAHTHHGHGPQSKGLVEGGGAEEADGVHGSKGTSAAAGVIPVGAYETGHGHNTTAGPHTSNLANKADPRVDSDLSKQQNHHYGRDATVAGAVGGAAYEANKHHHNSANTTAGPHSSNIENKVDPRVDSDRSREQHHYGRDAALAGGAGTAAYEADKHHHNTSHTTAGPHSSNIENKVDPRVDSDRSKEGHHYGRDAALAGGAAGTAYEANKHHNTHGLDQKPVGKDIGDKLHGAERNRGVNGPTGFPRESGHSVSAGSVGSGVPGAPRGNVQVSDNTHGHNSNIEPPVHNSTGPDHIFTAPVMDDPAANAALREGKIDQHEHRPGDEGVRGVGRDHGEDHSFSTGGGHEHSKSRGLENEIHSAPLGNTSSGSGLKHDNLAGHNTASAGTTALSHGSGLTGHNATSTGTTGLSHGSGLTGHNATSTGTTGLSHGSGLHGSGLTGYNTGSSGNNVTGLKHDVGLTGNNTTSTGTTGLSHGSGLTGHNTTSSGLSHGSGLTGSTGTHGLSSENRLGENSEFGNTTNNRVL